MVKRIEYELKHETKDIFFITFQQNKPPAIKPCMSRGLVNFLITRRVSLALSLAFVADFQVMICVRMALRCLVLSHPVGSMSGRMTVLSGITDGLV
jgi:hypothetical protein